MNSKDELKKHLQRVTESPNLVEFFESFAKTPAFEIKKDSFLANEGQPLEKVFVIKEGFIKLYSLSEEGKESIIYLLGPGYVLGARAFLSQDECATHNAQALTDLKIIAISHKEYLELISDHPEYLADLLQVFINRLVYTEKKLKGFISGDARSRIANFLLDVYERYAHKSEPKQILPLHLTHQRIAEFVGAIRETVTVSINQLQKQGILKDKKGEIEILSLAKLRSFVK